MGAGMSAGMGSAGAGAGMVSMGAGMGAGMGASRGASAAVLPVLYGYPSPALLRAKNLGLLHFGGDHLLSGAASW
eukprot:CAMPEP_0173189716 /NCGR_PEP_ID=MMETSP1141-20130122/11952_1 /TAXON_ID=483371 /ORGANISM="non described non described, Strain CCMP2298" /LENGTH=74 /DNA_ID=CAMNT_0014113761 /DNA_START=87 /DNA_END=308 /DNA_ORIENTATION=-